VRDCILGALVSLLAVVLGVAVVAGAGTLRCLPAVFGVCAKTVLAANKEIAIAKNDLFIKTIFKI
jgi:hypothetical protein